MTDIYEKINSGYYNNPIGYPGRKPTTFNCSFCESKIDKDDKFCKNCGTSVKESIEEKLSLWEINKKIYSEAEGNRWQKFKEDALEHCGYLGHRKADLIYSEAWDEGHHSGMGQILFCLKELCEFLDRFLE